MQDFDELHAAYRHARVRLEETTRSVDAMVARVARVLGGLRGEEYTSHDKTLRPNYIPGKTKWLNEMPTREELEQVLNEHDAARKAVVRAYGALPTDERRHAPNLPNAAG